MSPQVDLRMSKGNFTHYYNTADIAAAVDSGQHRSVIGGLWEEVGQLQLDFLLARGLRPQQRVLDIGCGSLRGGVKLIRYLDAGNYFGTDINQSLLTAGYEIELANEGLVHKLPRSHLVNDGEFDFSWSAVSFDVALAQSVFTHLPLNFLRACLERLGKVVVSGGSFYATIFEIPEDHPTHEPLRHAGGIVSHGTKDPFHYRFSDMEFCCRNLPWTAVRIGEWSHPRSQHMIQFIRGD
jgi:SAM-dependent methyltransferase